MNYVEMDLVRFSKKLLQLRLPKAGRVACRSIDTHSASKGSYKNYSEIPGPKGLFGLGSFYYYYPIFGKYSWDELHTSGMKKYLEYGPIVRERLYPGIDLLFLYDPDDIATLFNDTKCQHYPQRRSHLALQKYRMDRPHIYRSGGLLPTNGLDWWKLRSQVQKSLSSPKSVRAFLPLVDAVTKDFVDNLHPNQVIDMLPELSRLNLELTCLLAFDQRMNSFSEEERQSTSQTSKLMEATKTANSCILPTDQSFLWRLFETPAYKKLKHSQEIIESLAIRFVSEKMQCKNNENRNCSSILDEYLKNPNLEIADIVVMAADLLLAGVETTTFSTCFALYHLAKNPECQEKLFEEACNVLKDYNDAIIPEILNSKIPYTRATLKESLRLNPVSVGVGRILNDDSVFSGYMVPKGTIIVTQNMIACRLASNFEKPLDYVPERWLQRKGDFHPHLVLPFGHGMRACIARRLAEQDMLVLLLRIIRKYSIEWDGTAKLGVKTYLINNPDKPVNILLRKRI